MRAEALPGGLPPIVVVTTFFPNAAFPHRTVFVRNLTRAMRARARVEVIAPVPYAPPAPRFERWRKLRAIPGEEEIDGMIVAHPRYAAVPGVDALSGVTYGMAVLGDLRRRLRTHGPFLVHAHCAYPDGVGVARAAQRLGLPYVITAHGSDVNVYAQRRLLRPQVKAASPRACGVIAVSRAIEEKIDAMGAAVPIARIPCAGFDPALFAPEDQGACRDALGIHREARVALFVGNLVPVKAVDVLLEAWRLMEDDRARLILVGDGPERAALQARAAGLPGVTFLGALPQDQVARRMRAADLVALPSRSEGMPNVIVESLASGVPVVASRVGGITELVADGRNGILVEPGDPVALAGALRSAMGRRWDRAAVRASVAHLTWDALAERNLAFLARVAPAVAR